MKTFYTNWVEDTNGGYGKPQPTFEEAQKEAEKLARINPGKKVRILQCIGFVTLKDTAYEPCEVDEVPF